MSENITIDIGTTKTDKTKSAYIARTKNLYARFKNESPHKKEKLSDFVDWLIEQKPNITKSTWRQYKSSAAWFLESHNEKLLAEKLKNTNNDGCKPSKKDSKTSSLKKKSISEQEENKITAYLKETADSSFWAKPTLAFFKAMLSTGLRPNEWQSSVLVESPQQLKDMDFLNNQEPAFPILIVKNSKNTNGRAHGEFRHLMLGSLSKEEIIYIKIALRYATKEHKDGLQTPNGKSESWDEYYKNLRWNFYRVINNIFPRKEKRITLYSCRHQFIANLKAAGFSLEEIAALSGHATNETATTHYGKKRSGRKKSGLPVALESEVAQIKEVFFNPNKKKATPSPNRGI